MRHPRSLIILIGVALLAVVCVPLLSSVRSAATSVKIVNNSSRTIAHVFLSHVNVDHWSGDQLGDATIAPGHSFTLKNIACDQKQLRVIGEDEDGCFYYTVIDCGDTATWTITNNTNRDCGNEK